MDEGQIDPTWYQETLKRIPETESASLIFGRVVSEPVEIDDARCLWVPDWDRCLTQREVDDACRQVDDLLSQMGR